MKKQVPFLYFASVRSSDAWLRREIVPLLSSRALARSVVFVVFDEGGTSLAAAGASTRSPSARSCGAVDARPVSHYALLRTVEEAWGLPLLGRSATASPITGIWR